MGKIISVCWNLTSECGQKCKFCFRDTTNSVLTVQENKDILNRLAGQGIKRISFTGGEVTLYDGLWELVQYAHSLGIYSNIVTSGMTITGEFYGLLSQYADCLTLPIDALDADIQIVMGRDAGQSAKIFAILEEIRKRKINIDLKINTVVTSRNVDWIKAIYPLLRAHGVGSWKIFEFTPLRFRAIENRESFSLEDGAFEALKVSLTKEKERLNDPMKIIFQDSKSIKDSYIVILSDGSIAYDDNGMHRVIGDMKDADQDDLDKILQKIEFDFFDYQKRHEDLPVKRRVTAEG